jgi:hypothetical protein
MIMKLKIVLLSLATFALAACSVDQREASSHPPVIPDFLAKFDTEFGKLSLGSFNVFLYPEFKDAKDSRTYFEQIYTIKKDIDTLFAETKKIENQIPVERAHFDELKCLELAETYDAETDRVTAWKTVEGDDELKRLEACKANQDLRQGLQNQLTEKGAVLAARQDDLKSYVDSRSTPSRKLLKTLGGSSWIKIHEDGSVDVLFKDFLVENNKQSSDEGKSTIEAGRITDAHYDSGKRELRLTVPGLALNDAGEIVATGDRYEFVLARTPDSYGSANFNGKLFLYHKDGRATEEGRAIVGGTLLKNSGE